MRSRYSLKHQITTSRLAFGTVPEGVWTSRSDGQRKSPRAVGPGANGQAALETARSLIDEIVLTPASSSAGFDVELIGEIASVIRLGLAQTETGPRANGADPDLFARSIKVFAGTRNRLDLLLSG